MSKFNLEKELAKTNSFFFLKEFTFSAAKFRDGREEKELADGLIFSDSDLIFFQLKQRSSEKALNSDDKWFERSVLKDATKQVRDTLGYLNRIPEIRLRNHRNEEITIAKSKLTSILSLVVFEAGNTLSSSYRLQKYYRSKSAGIIQILPFEDYKSAVNILITTAELREYLEFRLALIERWGLPVNSISEKGILGQFLFSRDVSDEPSNKLAEYVDRVENDIDNWDLTGILSRFFERTYATQGGSYYPVLSEISKLRRTECKEFKLRFKLSMERAKANKVTTPTRITVPRTGCGFIFVPLPIEMKAKRHIPLQNFTLAHKYEQRLERCVGVSFVDDSDGWYLVDWCYAKTPWEQDCEWDEHLKRGFPLSQVNSQPLPSYSFMPNEHVHN